MTRPLLHATPPTGWLNDPNGSVVIDGVTHVFHQWNPDATTFGAMHWGHLVSADLVTWRHLGSALKPGSADAEDAAGCWSGCASWGPEGVEFFYTAVGGADHATQRPVLALPADPGLGTLRPVPGAVAEPPPGFSHDFRDPFVWGEPGRRRMLMSGRTASLEPVICVLDEAEEGWTHTRQLRRGDGLDLPGWLWECAHLMAGDEASALIVSCVEGHGHNERFSVWGATCPGQSLTGWASITALDDAGRLYAPQVFDHPDGRTLMIGWVRTQDDPAGSGREWTGALSLMRELTIVDGRLRQRPVAEIDRHTHPIPLRTGRATAAFAPQVGVEARVRTRGTLRLRSGERVWELPLGEWTRGAEARVFFDAGIVEVFACGRSWVVTDLSMERVDAVEVTGGELGRIVALGPRQG